MIKILGHGIWCLLAALSFIGCSTKLQVEADRGNVQSVIELLNEGESISETDAKGSTALHYAARSGQMPIVALFLDNGAEIDARNDYEETPLNLAVYYCKSNVVKFLIDKGANVHNRFKTRNGLWLSPIFNAGGNGCDSIILKNLLSAGADPNETEPEYGYSPLMFAADSKNLENNKILLAAGADVNHQAIDGATALIVAAKVGNRAAVELFLAAGANPTIRAEQGGKALHRDLEQSDTALTVAKRQGHNGIVLLLEAAENMKIIEFK